MKDKKNSKEPFLWGTLLIVILLLAINQIQILSIAKSAGISMMPKIISSSKVKLTGNLAEDANKVILLTGIPRVYGAELGIEYIHPSQTAVMDQMIKKMSVFDPTYGRQKITLSGDLLQRYIDIAIRISCEYCCGAKCIIRPDGQAACGCAHSQAMRGLAAYLLQNHSDEFTNDEILQELARWKGLYFPKQMMQKYISQVSTGEYTPDMAALIMGLDVKSSSGKNTPLPTDLSLPDMAGGC